MSETTEKPVISYSVAELKRATGISTSTIYAAIQSGDLPASKFGRKSVIFPEDARAWIKAQPSNGGAL